MKRSIKKYTSYILTVVMLYVMMAALVGPTAAKAEAGVSTSDFVFKKNDTGYTIERYYGSASSVTIPSELGGIPITEIGLDAFYMRPGLKSVTIPNTVTSIGSNAFLGTGLKTIKIPNSVKTMGGSIFFDCKDLESVEIGSGLESLTFYMFKDCVNLKKVTIADGVKGIADNVFVGTENLQTVNIPKSVTTISDFAFCDCYGLTAINVNSANPNYSSANGVLFDKEKTKLIHYPSSKTDKSYTMPSSVIRLCKDSFADCKYLESVKVSDGVTSLPDRTFQNCRRLSSVTLSSKQYYIGFYVFENCEKLTTITFPKSLYGLESKAFYNCSGMKEYRVEEGNERYYSVNGVLYGKESDGRKYLKLYPVAKKDEKFSIPSDIYGIGENCFREVKYLKELTIPSSVTYLGEESITKTAVMKVGQKAAPLKINNQSAVALDLTVNTVTDFPYESVPSSSAAVSKNGTVTAKKAGKVLIRDENERVKISVTIEFKDVSAKDHMYYYDAVNWAAEHGITAGVKNPKTGYYDTFDPNGECNRGQMVSFLWRMCGSPEPKKTTSTFTDIKKEAYYYKAVLWCEETGIVGGYSDHTFRPSNPCTRKQAVTFLWRLAGSRDPETKVSSFKDVKNTKEYYYKAVLWASESGITGGYSDGTFRPDNVCSRAQMVTFLYRFWM